MTADGRRSLPTRYAGVMEALELEQPRVVTADQLETLARAEGLTLSGTALGYQLRRLGWLLPLRTRGVWEFAPAARAGRYPAGDRHVELRAVLALDPTFPGVLAMDSAAVLLGLAGHVPEREVLAVPRGFRVSTALRDWRIIQLQLPGDATAPIDGLPAWRVEALLVGMATRPDGYRDWANVAQWLPRAAQQADIDVVASLLAALPRSSRQRAGYLLALGGRADDGLALLDRSAPDRAPVYLGPRDEPGRFDARFGVVDSVLAAGMDAVQP
ncbi:MAG: type IV toxin-antitoxin system AbiEi family antitoxin [Ilumatobacteraceae bacterium]